MNFKSASDPALLRGLTRNSKILMLVHVAMMILLYYSLMLVNQLLSFQLFGYR